MAVHNVAVVHVNQLNKQAVVVMYEAGCGPACEHAIVHDRHTWDWVRVQQDDGGRTDGQLGIVIESIWHAEET
eukprot:349627-Chlamydomonas_euryale.AAC.2